MLCWVEQSKQAISGQCQCQRFTAATAAAAGHLNMAAVLLARKIDGHTFSSFDCYFSVFSSLFLGFSFSFICIFRILAEFLPLSLNFLVDY